MTSIYRSQTLQIARNGAVGTRLVFIDGNCIITSDYWEGLSAQKQAQLAKRHPNIVKAFNNGLHLKKGVCS